MGIEIVLVEVKTTLRVRQVQKFIVQLQRAKQYLPKYRTYWAFGVVAYVRAQQTGDYICDSGHQRQRCHRQPCGLRAPEVQIAPGFSSWDNFVPRPKQAAMMVRISCSLLSISPTNASWALALSRF